MDIDFEREVSQNAVLGSAALWAATNQYCEDIDTDRGVPIAHLFLVIPLVFHRQSAETIYKLQMTAGSFYRAMTDEKTITVGLQRRLQNHSRNTFEALNLAFASKLLILDQEELEVIPGRKSLPFTYPKHATDAKNIVAAGKRVGNWLAVTEFPVLCKLLRIRF
ncbi:MAG TPA: hypothetical protein DD473_12870 [Planctomycetaceae bacterium]|uniref:three component ABC system middle component n=1 Tax=Rubinisphaera sp. TaxID=2024857 RepID=UPI000C0E34D8|nr:three component ABC system middle component [Rubinisphaera sp.]MBV07907.1 hypothetical protein [Rubinisphaera sp.]HBN76684.1 hypothetical protein [Planctomycetaceae bacterium]|tara:strand:+ start:751 stop:1242 length:492 start_codon:yes stop_codon:yes gene_type:complete